MRRHTDFERRPFDDLRFGRSERDPGNNVPDSSATAMMLVGSLLAFAGICYRR